METTLQVTEVLTRIVLLILTASLTYFISEVGKLRKLKSIYNSIFLKIIVSVCSIASALHMLYLNHNIIRLFFISSITLLIIYIIILHKKIIFKKYYGKIFNCTKESR